MKENWYEDPRLNDIPPQKRKLITDFFKQAKALPKEQLPSAYLGFRQEAQRKQLTFTEAESALLTEILLSKVSPEEKKRFQLLKTMLQSHH